MLSEWKPGLSVDGEPVLLQSVETKTDARGKTRMAGSIGDASGSMPFVCWSPWIFRELRQGDVVIAQGTVGEWNGSPQFTVEEIELATPGDQVDLSVLVKTAQMPPDAAWNELIKILLLPSTLATAVVLYFCSSWGERFREHPAAKSVHHAVRGGLVYHTLSMLRMARELIPVIARPVDSIVVYLGILFHDVGKLAELGPPGAPYTPAELAGHVAIGSRCWHQAMDAAEREIGRSDPALRLAVDHVILSHHGSKDRGAPVEPKTPEALLVHCVDLLDSRLAGLWEATDAHVGEGPATSWAQGGTLYASVPAIDPLAMMLEDPVGPGIRGVDPEPAPAVGPCRECPECGHPGAVDGCGCTADGCPCGDDDIPF